MHFLLSSFFVLLFFLFSFTVTYAAPNQLITVVSPVRGEDFWQLSGVSPLDNVKKIWQEVSRRNLSTTWLVRPDGFKNSEIVDFFKGLPKNQELGLFMEVTPTWTSTAGVTYRESPNWHFAGSVFLTGYEVSERHKLIDSAFEDFKKNFGYYPKSVGAWWIDGGSLSYMREKYGILANMDVADQYTTDNYQIWGQYFSTPFYPSKKNALQPASGEDQKIGVVTIQWATRDPYNSYGNGVLDSTYSLQANDYANPKYHDLNTDYFKRLLNIYLDNNYSRFGAVTVGLENDFSWDDFGGEFINQLEVVSARQKTGTQVVTMSQFASSYKILFPGVSPAQIIFADDPLGGIGKVVWFQTTRYRMGWFFTPVGSVVRDLRQYKDGLDEPCLSSRCDKLNLAETRDHSIDEVTYNNPWIIDEGKINDVKVIPITDGLRITYTNQVGVLRVIDFLPNDVRIDNNSLPIPVVIAQATDASHNIKKIEHRFGNKLVEAGNVIQKQFLGLLIFIAFSFVFFYLPGLSLLKKSNLDRNVQFVLSFVVGLVLLTLLFYILGYLKLSWVLWGLPLAALLVVRKNLVFPQIVLTKEVIFGGLVIVLGSISWLLTSFKNGLIYDYGMGFWGPHGHDGIWHISLIENLKKGLPPENPIFSGINLQNYHYFYDLLLSGVSNITNLEVVDLYFRFFPLLLSILTGLVVYILAKQWFKSSLTAIFAVFFVYFGGSFGWVLSYFQTKGLGGETLFWAQQGISTLINPPLSVSFLTFLTGLYLFLKIVSQKQYYLSLVVPLIIVWGTLIEFKAYGGVLVLGALAVVTFTEIIRRNWQILKISFPTVLLSGLVFLPNNIGGSSLLVFSPFWLIHSMVDFPDRLSSARLTNARLAGLEMGNWFKFLASEGIGLLIFIFGNLGTRIIGFLAVKNLWFLNIFNLFIVAFLLLALIIPMLFIQKGANFNIVQFFYYFLLVSNFLAAASLVFFVKKFRTVGWIIAGIMVLLTLPTTWDTLHHYVPERPPARISRAEVEALTFLKSQPDGVVLSSVYDERSKKRFTEPIPMFAYTSTSYVGAISGKSEYVADTINLEILGIDYKGRLQATKDILLQREPEVVSRLLKEGNIQYLYIPKYFQITIDEARFPMKKIFNNEEVEIFKVL